MVRSPYCLMTVLLIGVVGLEELDDERFPIGSAGCRQRNAPSSTVTPVKVTVNALTWPEVPEAVRQQEAAVAWWKSCR